MDESIQNLSKIDFLLSSGPVTFGEVHYQPRGTCGPRMQGDFQLVVIHQGEALIAVDGEEHDLPAHHVALLKPGHLERFEFARGSVTHHSWCSVAPASLEEPFRRELLGAPFSLPLTARLSRLVELGLGTPATPASAVHSWLGLLGEACLRAYLMEAEGGKDLLLPEPLRLAQCAIETRFAEPLSLKSLAQTACVTPAHLIRLFQSHLKTTPSRLLWKLRIERGLQLLADTGLSVAEIAYRSGFECPFHFSRKVREATGMPPRQFRAERWNAPSGKEAKNRV